MASEKQEETGHLQRQKDRWVVVAAERSDDDTTVAARDSIAVNEVNDHVLVLNFVADDRTSCDSLPPLPHGIPVPRTGYAYICTAQMADVVTQVQLAERCANDHGCSGLR